MGRAAVGAVRRERGRPVWTVDLGRIRELTGIVVDFLLRRPRPAFGCRPRSTGCEWVTVTERAYDRRLQRAEFTALGRYVRSTPRRGVGAIPLTDVAVLGTV